MSIREDGETQDANTAVADVLARIDKEIIPWLKSLGFGSAIAQDAVQEAVLRYLERRADGRASTIRDLRAWLATVAKRIALADIRKRRRERTLSPVIEPAVDPFFALDQEEEDWHRLEAINASLGMLPEDRRSVYLLHAIERRPIRKIAEDLNTTFGRANHCLRLARQDIKDQIRIRGFDLPESA